MFKSLCRLFFPPRCTFCSEVIEHDKEICICDKCISALPYVGKNLCKRCSAQLPSEFSLSICSKCRSRKVAFDGSFIPLKYNDIVRKAILKLKFYNKPSYAKTFAIMIADKILSSENIPKIDAITFVPSSKKTIFKRGYNQAQLIANEISRILNVPCINTLKRMPSSKRQATLKGSMRRENARKSYSKTDVKLSGNILLVDDVFTTGWTAHYCSKLLKQMGALKVFLAIAAINDK